MDAGNQQMNEDDDSHPFGGSNRFAHFMFQLETLAASASMAEYDFKEWIEVATLAWGAVHGQSITCHVEAGPPPEKADEETNQ